MLVTAGVPDPDHMEWVAVNKKFFVPVKALSKIFRRVFMEKLFFALQVNRLRIPEKQKGLYAAMGLFKKEPYSKLWHGHIKKTFKGPNQVVSYLGRYTLAISKRRILDTDGRTEKFRWKDYRDNKNKTLELQSAEFIR